MTTSHFKGKWSGLGEGITRAKIHMRITQTRSGLRGYAIAKAVDDTGEIFEIEGKEDNPEKAIFDLVDYVSDDIRANPLLAAQIVLTARPDIKQIDGFFVTDIGSHGKLRFRKARFWSSFQLSIPIIFHKLYRLIKRKIRMRFRIAYLFLLICLALLSIAGKLSIKFNIFEVIIILLPLLFLYSDKIRNLITEISVRKFGPVEFQEQPKPSPTFNITRTVNALSTEFGNNVALFSAMAEFFVPNTKNLLRLLVSLDKTVNIVEFNKMAKKIGVFDQNLDVTLKVLVDAGTITINNIGEIEVQEIGKKFLDFEARLERINQQ